MHIVPGRDVLSVALTSVLAAAVTRPLVFLDIEASSLRPGSWPVEIGLAWSEAARIRTQASLIAPRADWSIADWSETSARLHGIARAELRGSPSADRVATEIDWLAGCEVVSDNPGWDQRWLDRLRADRAPRIEITGLRNAIRRHLDDRAASALGLALFRSPAPHRAGPDAARLASAWAAARAAEACAA